LICGIGLPGVSRKNGFMVPQYFSSEVGVLVGSMKGAGKFDGFCFGCLEAPFPRILLTGLVPSSSLGSVFRLIFVVLQRLLRLLVYLMMLIAKPSNHCEKDTF
jgi:hypothetical protein